jgi:hypothetical protein
LDVHREFCEVAISEDGRVRSAGRIRSRRPELELFALSLGSDDEVALEATGGAEAIAGILRPHVARVVVVNAKKLRAISEAKAKTDRLDARRLAELLGAGYVAEVWCPDEGTRALRRWVARRAQLVRQRSGQRYEEWYALADRLNAVQERVHRGPTGLDPVREAVAARAPVVGRHVDCLRRATLDHLSLDAPAFQRAVLERRGDRRRRFGGVLELGHGVPPSCRCRGRCLLASVLLDETVDPPGGPLGVQINGETRVWFESDRPDG